MVRTASVILSIACVSAQDFFLERVQTVVDARGPVHSCMSTCLKTDHSKHFKKCESGGSADCSKSKCCVASAQQCYVKNPYWAACQSTCVPGKKDQFGEKWDCTPLSPDGCTHLQACMDGCHSLGASNSTLDDLDLIDDAEPEEDPELAEELVSSLSEDSLSLTAEAHVSKSKCRWSDISGLTANARCRGECRLVHISDPKAKKVCENVCDQECPLPHCASKKGLTACVSSCKKHSKTNDSGSHCEKDGATNCLNSKCCQMPGAKCFTKNPYWAACTGECTPGKKNPLDNQVWDCKELKGKQVCDPFKYRKCVNECVDNC